MKKYFLLNIFLIGLFSTHTTSIPFNPITAYKVAVINKEIRDRVLTMEQTQLIAKIVNAVAQYSDMLWAIEDRVKNGENQKSRSIQKAFEEAHKKGNAIFTLIGKNQREQLLESGLKGEDVLYYSIKGFKEAGIHPHCWLVFHHYSAQFINYEWTD